MSVSDKVRGIIVEQLGVESDEVTPEASFTDDLGADSLDIVELVMAFEEEFDIEIPDEDAEKIGRVKEAIDYIESQSLLGSPSRIRARWSEAVPAGLTGVIVRCDRDEELALAAELAGTRDIDATGTHEAGP